MANRFRRIEESLLNLYHNAMRFHWTHHVILEERQKIIISEDYQKLLRIEKCHMDGVMNTSWRFMSRETTHAYLCVDGLFRPWRVEGYTGYDQPFDSTNRSLIPDTCILVWTDAPDHLFSITGKAVMILDEYKPDWIKTSHTTILPIERPFKEFVVPYSEPEELLPKIQGKTLLVKELSDDSLKQLSLSFNLTEDAKEPC